METVSESDSLESETISEGVIADEDQEITEQLNEEDDEDEFSKELSSIDVSGDEQEPAGKPRIPIMELPPLEQPKTSSKTAFESEQESMQ